MKIGILTFHWATNYGAVLQCYALQEYLRRQGHDVEVINYKPLQYEETLYKFIRGTKFFHLSEYVDNYKIEKSLVNFRHGHLCQTKRVNTIKTVSSIANNYDLIISGSDQVANPAFLLNGEGAGIITPTYFLGFPFKGKRVGYALSFGCVTYPDNAIKIASKYVKDFDAISVREKSGVDILASLGRYDVEVVPDPTLLQQSDFYCDLLKESPSTDTDFDIYCFFIRNIVERKSFINNKIKDKKILWNNEDKDYSLPGWLHKIQHAGYVITDSFHCMVMCLKLHTPFVIITDMCGNVGMNDRLYTLLTILDLVDCIQYKGEIVDFLLNRNFDWQEIDTRLFKYMTVGCNFLSSLQ